MKKLIKYIAKVISITIVAITLSMPVGVNARSQELDDALDNGFKIVKPSGLESDVMDIFDEFMGDDFYIELVQPDGLFTTYMYVLAPKHKEMAYVIQWAYDGNYEAMMEWETLTHELEGLSSDVHRVSSTRNNNKYLLIMLNPSNYENFVWIAFDGETAYDYVIGLDDMDELNLELY